MAIDPDTPVATVDRFLVNDATKLLRLEVGQPRDYLIHSATRLIQGCPPSLPWASGSRPHPGALHRGLFRGPTSSAYFFWTLSRKHGDIQIQGRRPLDWCKAYLDLGQDVIPPMLDISCGVVNEYLASNALKACVYQSQDYANKVIEALHSLETDPTYCEFFKGRVGALYLLRLIQTWLPNLDQRVRLVVTSLIEAILSQDPWVWNGKEYLGTVHGSIGVLTQVILSDPSYAPKFEAKLLWLLNLQSEDGNWPVIENKDIGLVQFCHGAPGFVLSLLAIKEHFPNIQKQIDSAIVLGRKLIWEKGLLTKEPNICHGILGNALALEGQQREHFLALATPEKIQKGVTDGVFEENSEKYGLLWGEAGVAWVWMNVLDGAHGRCVLYTDV